MVVISQQQPLLCYPLGGYCREVALYSHGLFFVHPANMSTIVKLFFSKTGFGEEELDSGGQGIGHQSQISYGAQCDGGMQIY